MRRLFAFVSALAAASCVNPPAASAWVDPVNGLPYPTGVTRRAEIPEKNWQPGHRGVDLRARVGQTVLAAEDGEVVFAGVVVGTPTISILHDGGLRTTYQPATASVAVGDRVSEGQVIGVVARPVSRFAHEHEGLHWGALTGPDQYIDPLSLLEAPRIRLKPVPAGG